jgi:predicted GNAT family acetyltransferase
VGIEMLAFPTHRTCNVCQEAKELSAFGKCSADKTYGVKNRCKQCASEERNAYYAANRDKEAKRHIEYREANLEAIRQKRREYQAKWVTANHERKRLMDSEYQKQKRLLGDPVFKAKSVERNARYFSRRKAATPLWANIEKIEAFYVQAQLLTQKTGVKHEVDHIVPLQGRRVTGFHVESNLQVIPKALNRAKSNRYAES